MRSFRRIFLVVVLLGIAITLVVILQRRGDHPSIAGAPGTTRHAVDLARTSRQVALADESSASIAVSNDGLLDSEVAQCAQMLKEAADFVSSERNATRPLQAADPNDEQRLSEAQLANAQRRLAASSDPEYFLVAMLLTPPGRPTSNDASAEARLLDFGDRATRSGSKLLAWHALRECAAAKQSCPIAHLEQRLLEADRGNAEAWVLVATMKYERGDAAGALAAMQGAASAPTSTWYWPETIGLIERALAAQTEMPFADRLANAFGAGASALPSQSNVLRMCNAEAPASRAWGDACLAFGTLRAERNETDMARTIAYLLRERVLTARGDRERAAEASTARALFAVERSSSGRALADAMQGLQSVLIEADPGRFRAYLGAIQHFGERAGARMFLRQEVPPLLERAGLLERDGIRECAADLFLGTRPATGSQQARTGDEFYITMRSASEGWSRRIRVGPDGKITLPVDRRAHAAGGNAAQPDVEIAAAGKTAGQLQREIATTLSAQYQAPEVQVSLLSRRSDEELRTEFDNARKEAAERRSQSR
jgi:hypothetical protein